MLTDHGTIWSLHSTSIAWREADGASPDRQSEPCADEVICCTAHTAACPDADETPAVGRDGYRSPRRAGRSPRHSRPLRGAVVSPHSRLCFVRYGDYVSD